MYATPGLITARFVVTLAAATAAWLPAGSAAAQEPIPTTVDLAPGAVPGDRVVLEGTVGSACEPGTAEIGFSSVSMEDGQANFPEPYRTGNEIVLARPDVAPGEAFSIEVVLPDPGILEPTLYFYCLVPIPGEDEEIQGEGEWGPYSLAGASTDGGLPGTGVDLPPFGQPTGPTGPVDAEAAAAFRSGRPHVVTAIPTPSEAPWDLGAVALAALIAVALVFLIVFPSELFNSTLDEHYDDIKAAIRRRLPWIGERDPRPALDPAPATDPDATAVDERRRRGWVGFLAMLGASALLYGFLDPGFGVNRASLVLLLGIAAGVAVSSLLSAATTGALARRRFGRADYWFKVMPGTLLIAAACVAISRLVGFLPGYLYGLIGGLAFGQSLDDEDQARMALASSSVVLAAAVAGWFAYGLVATQLDGGNTSLALVTGEAILAGTFIAGVEGLLFGLLPLRYLPGEKLFRWSRGAWAAIYLPTMFAFVHLVARPAARDDPSAVDWVKALILFAAFGLASVAFWAYWRRRDEVAAGA